MPVITVRPGVYIVGGPQLSHLVDTNVYLVHLKNFYILIDSGSVLGVNAILLNLMEMNVRVNDIKYVILTHAHFHAASGAYLFNNVDTLIIAHEPDAYYMRSLDYDKLGVPREYAKFINPIIPSVSIPYNREIYEAEEGELILIHAPGHTKGFMIVLIPSLSILFVSDLTLNILSHKWGSCEAEYRRSIEKAIKIVEEYDVDVMCSSYRCIWLKQRIIEFLKQVIREKPLWV